MTTILIKKKDTAGAPAPGDLTNSAGGTEIAVNTATKRIYTKDSGGNIVELGTNSTSSTIANLTATTSATLSYGTANQVQYLNGSKTLTGSANLTFNGTTLTANTIGAFTLGGTIAGGGNQINNVIIGSSTPLAGSFTTTSASGVATFSAGTVSAPAITTTGDTNTGIYFPATDTIAFTEGGVESMRIDSSGNVGIGNSSPVSDARLVVASGGAVGMEFSPGLAIAGENRLLSYNRGTNVYVPMIYSASQHKWFTFTTERMRIDSSGIITMSAYGAGAATFSASGVISSVSDETWKIKDGVPTNPDAMLQKLEAGYWFYNEEKAPIFGKERQLGFYAQNVHEAIGEEAAPTPEEGKPWGYHDRSVLAITVMSLKNALSTIEELKQRIATLENK